MEDLITPASILFFVFGLLYKWFKKEYADENDVDYTEKDISNLLNRVIENRNWEKQYSIKQGLMLDAIGTYTQELIELRRGNIPLDDFLFYEEIDALGESRDRNYIKRFRLLKALQYNQLDSDENLIRELFKAEIKNHKRTNFQGLLPTLKLNAYLLLKYSKPEHALLFLEAKRTNFDAFIGFEFEFLVSAGFDETDDFLETQGEEVQMDFYSVFDEFAEEFFESEEHVFEWKKYLKEVYPEKLIFNEVMDEIELAFALEEKEILVYLLKGWYKTKQTLTGEEVQWLYFYASNADDIQLQIWALEEQLKIVNTDRDKAHYLQELASLLIKNKQYRQAHEKIGDCTNHLKYISEWKTSLGYAIVENAFEVVIGINDKNDGDVQDAYDWAIMNIESKEDLGVDLIKKIVLATALMEDTELQTRFLELLEVKIDELKRTQIEDEE